MARVVLKFGGTSVGDRERLKKAAARVAEYHANGDQVLVVVSAMAGVTDDLTRQCTFHLGHSARDRAERNEFDSVLAAGEQITSGLMALELRAKGIKARSWLGWQLPLRYMGEPQAMSMEEADKSNLAAFLDMGDVPVVAGFQGVDDQGRIRTLGRGGSDLTAVYLAHSIKADRCVIYTDVPGIYTADPKIVPKATRLERISYEEMLSFAALGAKVLEKRSVEMAMRNEVVLEVKSSFEKVSGTIVEAKRVMSTRRISGIALSANVAKVMIKGVRDEPGTVAAIFAPLASHNIAVGMIVQDVAQDNRLTNVTFTVANEDAATAIRELKAVKDEIGFQNIDTDSNVVKISVVGPDLESYAGLAQIMFDALAERSINIQAISTSEVRISVLVSAEHAEDAVRALHKAYGLDFNSK